MKLCPTCKGSCKQIIKVCNRKTGMVEKEIPVHCGTCNGEGKVTEETLKNIMYEKSLYCSCKNNDDVYFVDDNVDSECSKHHWKCKNCKKIVQIG